MPLSNAERQRRWRERHGKAGKRVDPPNNVSRVPQQVEILPPIDPDTFDREAILRQIAADPSQTGASRVAACRELRCSAEELRAEPTMQDRIRERAIKMMAAARVN
jgi:hypothetical protein